jgi:uncharacterized membrane protein
VRDRVSRAILGSAFGAAIVCMAECGLAAVPSAIEADTGLLQRTFYKSLSYQALSTIDDFLFGYIVGGSLAVGGFLALANAASELGLNYGHDLTWTLFTRGEAQSEAETRAARTGTYTAVNAARVFGLGLLLTGHAALSLGYVAFNAVADAAVYWANDLIWGVVWPVQPQAVRPSPSVPPVR